MDMAGAGDLRTRHSIRSKATKQNKELRMLGLGTLSACSICHRVYSTYAIHPVLVFGIKQLNKHPSDH
jgi:hypothetical protein